MSHRKIISEGKKKQRIILLRFDYIREPCEILAC